MKAMPSNVILRIQIVDGGDILLTTTLSDVETLSFLGYAKMAAKEMLKSAKRGKINQLEAGGQNKIDFTCCDEKTVYVDSDFEINTTIALIDEVIRQTSARLRN